MLLVLYGLRGGREWPAQQRIEMPNGPDGPGPLMRTGSGSVDLMSIPRLLVTYCGCRQVLEAL